MPASVDSVAVYLAACAVQGLAVSTINQHAAAIRYAHKPAGFEPPTAREELKATLSAIRRKLGTAPRHGRPGQPAA